MPTSEQTTFWLTSNPYGESFDHLKYLIHYPYGCIEQTTSSTRPLLYVGNIVEQSIRSSRSSRSKTWCYRHQPRAVDGDAVGRLRLLARARRSPSSGAPYATHMLLDAKKAGYAVPDDRLQAC